MRTKLTILLALLTISFSAASAPWTKVASISVGPTTGSFSWVIGKRVFAGGGNKSMDLLEYDAVKNQWSSKGKMGGNMYHTFGMAFVANGKGYVIGGDTAGAQSTSASVWEYEPVSNQWTLKGQFPGGKRKQGFCFAINNVAYIGGGSDGTNNFNNFYKYDPALNQWQASSVSLPMGYIEGAASFVLNGKGYVCGGEEYIPSQNNFEGRNAVWEFDPSMLTWRKKSDMPEDKVFPLGLTVGNLGYVIGGSANFATTSTSVWKYNPSTDKWTAGDAYPNNYTIFAIGFALDTVYYVGAGANLSGAGATPTDAFYRHGDVATAVINTAFTASGVTIFPNPAKSTISISGLTPADIGRLTVTNIQGQAVMSMVAPKSVTDIQIADLPSGVYYLRLDIRGSELALPFTKE